MKNLFLLFIVILSTHNAFSQTANALNDIQKVTYSNEYVQVKAEFPNGEKKFNDFILDNFKKPLAKDALVEIQVRFIVEIDGTVSNVEVINDVENSTGNELKRVIMNSPKWLPAEHEGYRVRAQVKFNLNMRKMSK
jgi:hypothetical protein